MGPSGFGPQPSEITQFLSTAIKLDIPHFDGSNAIGWIFKITQFFDFCRTPEDLTPSHCGILHGGKGPDLVSVDAFQPRASQPACSISRVVDSICNFVV